MSFGLEVWNGNRLFRIDGTENLLVIKDVFTVTIQREAAGEIVINRPNVVVGDMVCVLPYEYVEHYSHVYPTNRTSVLTRVVRAKVTANGKVTVMYKSVWPEDGAIPAKDATIFELMVFRGV